MFLKNKQTGFIKGRGFADGPKLHRYSKKINSITDDIMYH